MFDKLEDLLIRYEELMSELSEPDVANNPERFRKLMKEQSDILPIVEAYKEYKQCKQNIEDSLAMLEEESDEEMRELAKEELNDAKNRVAELENELKILLLPKDPNDDKNVIVEIRAGAGGDEAALFAAEIYRMYQHYAETKNWKTEIMECDDTGIGGMKSVTFMITGAGAYSVMKYESGVHRVQRVPETESGGRIHTSTITVAVMPEAEDVDVQIDEKDIRIDVCRASGAGGQCVNTTDSAVRLTHIPTGIVIYNQTEKSQIQNKAKAFALLRTKLYDLEQQKQHQGSRPAKHKETSSFKGDVSLCLYVFSFSFFVRKQARYRPQHSTGGDAKIRKVKYHPAHILVLYIKADIICNIALISAVHVIRHTASKNHGKSHSSKPAAMNKFMPVFPQHTAKTC